MPPGPNLQHLLARPLRSPAGRWMETCRWVRVPDQDESQSKLGSSYDLSWLLADIVLTFGHQVFAGAPIGLVSQYAKIVVQMKFLLRSSVPEDQLGEVHMSLMEACQTSKDFPLTGQPRSWNMVVFTTFLCAAGSASTSIAAVPKADVPAQHSRTDLGEPGVGPLRAGRWNTPWLKPSAPHKGTRRALRVARPEEANVQEAAASPQPAPSARAAEDRLAYPPRRPVACGDAQTPATGCPPPAWPQSSTSAGSFFRAGRDQRCVEIRPLPSLPVSGQGQPLA